MQKDTDDIDDIDQFIKDQSEKEKQEALQCNDQKFNEESKFDDNFQESTAEPKRKVRKPPSKKTASTVLTENFE